MPSIRITDVPEGTYAVLRRRAAAAGQSLPEYLRAGLIEEAKTPTLDEVLTPARGRAGGRLPFSTAARIFAEDRAHR